MSAKETAATAPDAEEEQLAAFLFRDDRKSVVTEKRKLPVAAAAWEDSGDEVEIANGKSRLRKLRRSKDESEISGFEYERRLRDQFEKIHGKAQWAETLKQAETQDSEPVEVVNTKRSVKTPGSLELRKMRDVILPGKGKSNGGVISMAMIGNLLAVATVDKISVRIFRVGEKGAETISDIKMAKKFRVRSLEFLDERTLVMVGPQRGVLFWDVVRQSEISYHPSPGGRFERDGWTQVRTVKTSENVWTVVLSTKHEISMYKYPGLVPIGHGARLNAELVGLDIVQNAEGEISVFAADKATGLYELSAKTGAIVDRKSHASLFQPLSFAATENFLLVGGGSGVVEAVRLTGGRLPKDLEANTTSFDRLTTPVETLVAVPGADAFVSASMQKTNAARIGNLISGHTQAGWPKSTDKFGVIISGCATSHFVCLGTANGRALLFHRKH